MSKRTKRLSDKEQAKLVKSSRRSSLFALAHPLEDESTPNRRTKIVKSFASALGVKLEKAQRSGVPRFIFETAPTILEPPHDQIGLYDLFFRSWVFRQILRAIRQEVLGAGVDEDPWTVEPLFQKRCTECGKDFDVQVEECDRCAAKGRKVGVEYTLRDPDESEHYLAEQILHRPNPDYNFFSLLSSTLSYSLALDDFYWSIVYGYEYDFTVEPPKLVKKAREIYVEDSRFMRPIADGHGHLGNNEFFCPVCYDSNTDQPHIALNDEEVKQNKLPFCPMCGGEMIQTCWIMNVAGQVRARLGRDEVVHGSGERVLPDLFGNPKILSLAKLAEMLNSMDEYNLGIYTEGKVGSMVVFPGMEQDQIDSMLLKAEQAIERREKQDLISGKLIAKKKIRTVFLGVKEPAVRVPVMEDFERMQSLDFYKLAVEKVCFSPRTPVLTDDGWKQICDIKAGENVLTHKGNWRPVLAVTRREYGGSTLTFKVRGAETVHGFNELITPTPEHPILTARGWVQAKDLMVGDEVALIGGHCKTCGVPTQIGSRFCSQACRNKARIYKRKPLGTHSFIRSGEAGAVLERAGYKCEICGNAETSLNVHHVLCKELTYGKQDNSLENLVCLCTKHHADEALKIALAIRRLKALGRVGEFNSAFEHGLYSVIYRPIIRILQKQRKRTLPVYNLRVGDDESYVANTVIVHNCAVYGVTPVFVSIIESGKSGNNPRMQIDVQDHTTREIRRLLESVVNEQLFPLFGIHDWVWRFGAIQQRDDLRMAQIDQLKAATALAWKSAGFTVKLDEKGELEVSGEATAVPSETPQIPGMPAIPSMPRESEASGDLLGGETKQEVVRLPVSWYDVSKITVPEGQEYALNNDKDTVYLMVDRTKQEGTWTTRQLGDALAALLNRLFSDVRASLVNNPGFNAMAFDSYSNGVVTAYRRSLEDGRNVLTGFCSELDNMGMKQLAEALDEWRERVNKLKPSSLEEVS